MVRIPSANVKNYPIADRIVRGIAKQAMPSIILLECFVTGGRSINAYKRGGFIEARERFTEDSLGALFWFSGVVGFNKMNDKIGQKLLKLHTANFDGKANAVRNPVKNFLNDAVNKFKNTKITKNKIAGFKVAKVTASVLLANALVGFAVPKLNQHITKLYQKDIEKKSGRKNTSLPRTSMEDFVKTKKDISFKGAAEKIMSIVHNFEHKPQYQLLSTDAGIVGGRAISARNNHERTEVVFRDLSSSFFYLFNVPLINMLFNKISDGRISRLDPVAAKQVNEVLRGVVEDSDGKINKADFLKKVWGEGKVPKYIEDLKGETIEYSKLKEIILKESPDVDILRKARRMATLQPKIEGKPVLTSEQVQKIFKGGAMNDHRVLRNIYEVATGGDYKESYKFIENSTFKKLHGDITAYVEQIAKNNEITAETLEKAVKRNFRKNAIHWGTGFAISALFLSTLIPKIQYWITKRRTGEDKFPGVTEYSAGKK